MHFHTDHELAQKLLQPLGLSASAAARLLLEAAEEIRDFPIDNSSRISQLREVIHLGVLSYKERRLTVSLHQAIQFSIHIRKHGRRRSATLADFRYLSSRLLRVNPHLDSQPLRSMGTQECRAALHEAFKTPSQFKKGRMMLQTVFSDAMKQGWCSENPIRRIDVPKIMEKSIRALSIDEVDRLISTCLNPDFTDCAPGIAIMLWAGVRPMELTRMTGKDISMEDNVISFRSSKTGKPRHVHMQPVLKHFLSRFAPFDHAEPICPKNWRNKWRTLRIEAGFSSWKADTLRHTFASYHAKYFKNFSSLQLDMGHRDSYLLWTRYVNVEGVTTEASKKFWSKRISFFDK